MAENALPLTDSAYSFVKELPFFIVALRFEKGNLTPLAVSSDLVSYLGMDETTFLTQIRDFSICEDEDKSKLRSLIQYAILYAEEGEESHALLHLHDARNGSVPISFFGRAQPLASGAFLVFLIGSTNPPSASKQSDEKSPLLTSPLNEEFVLCRYILDLTSGAILGSHCPEGHGFTLFESLPDTATLLERFERLQGIDPAMKESFHAAYSVLLNASEKTPIPPVFRLEFPLSEQTETPTWARLELSGAYDPMSGHVVASFLLVDATMSLLENKLMGQLSEFGFDVVGLIALPSTICRFFRLQKLGLGMKFATTMPYQEAILRDLPIVVAKEDAAEVTRQLDLATIIDQLGKWPSYQVAYSITSRDGNFKRKRFQFSYLDGTKKTLFFARSDLTAIYLKEKEQIDQLKAAKLQADKANESKSMFFSAMSHDLRAPLNGILGFTDLALREKDPAAKDADLVQIQSSGKLLLGMVNDTLDLSSIESGKTRLSEGTFNLKEAFDAVLSSLASAASLKSIAIVVDERPPSLLVSSDELKFEKIFLNLLSNAIKYTPNGGVVHLTLRREKDGLFTLIVADNGIGIRPEFVPHLYEAYSQDARPESKTILGTGLGLAIVKHYVDFLGGTITLVSQPNQGTCFTVSLPLKVVSAEAPLVIPHYDESGLAGKRVLLAEDNYINVQVAKALLSEKNILVDVAENGALAVTLFSQSSPSYYAAILMDYQMPLLNGIEATKKIRSLARPDHDLPIIALSGEGAGEEEKAFLDAGMNATLLKPIEADKMFTLLSALWTRPH